MEYIDITKKLEEFYHHLSAADVDRTIFSAKFGDGKTEFLHQFKEKYSDEYTFYTLYPVNYQIAPNEQVMEYIKRDLLFQLIKNNTLTPIADIPKSVLLQWYLNENPLDIMKSITKCAFTIEEGIKKGDFEKATEIIGNLSEGAGNIYELDSISYLIAKSIINQDKKPVLIIEDLDRIDPAHLFRILNIFSAHIDREYLCSEKKIFKAGEEIEFDTLPNKFNFDKIIFVMDDESTKAAFRNFYGNSNYEGYISKFISKRVFHYSITGYAHKLLYAHISEKCGMNQNLFDTVLSSINIKIEGKSVRDIAKVLDGFEDAYRRAEVKIADFSYFLSDTPLVKLLATLLRLGVERKQLPTFLKAIENEYKKIQTEVKFLQLLGCFAMSKESFNKNKEIYYNKQLYQIEFTLDLNGYLTFKKVNTFYDRKITKQDNLLKINLSTILRKALKYVN